MRKYEIIGLAADQALAGVNWEQLLAALQPVLPTPGAAAPPLEGRWQDRVIEELIPAGASVLDLGCGRGELLLRLEAARQIKGQGVELDPEAVIKCVERGVPVFQTDLDAGLKGFPDQSFDYVIIEETLPTLRRPLEVLDEMLRVGKAGIISFPNFGHWRVRLHLFAEGRMPVTERLPQPWHQTDNLRLFTIRDFFEWAKGAGVDILKTVVVVEGRLRAMTEDDNWLAEEALVVLRRKNGRPSSGKTDGQL